MKNSSKKIIAAGVVAGAAAYLLNTEKGKKFQEEVKTKAVEVGSNLKVTMDNTTQTLKEKAESTSAIASEKINALTESAKSFVKSNSQKGEEFVTERVNTATDQTDNNS